MKKNKLVYILSILFLLGLSSCQKDFNERYLITENSIEFDDAVVSAFAVGKDYPIVTKNISLVNNEVTFQVNLSGKQLAENQTLKFKVVDSETTAVEGRDYAIAGGKTFTVNANTSKSMIKVQSLPTGVGSTVLVLELVGNEQVKVAKNYKRVAVKCVYP